MRGGSSADYRKRDLTHEELLALYEENRQRTLARIRELQREGLLPPSTA